MLSFRPRVLRFHRTLMGTLISCCLLADHVTGIIDYPNTEKFPAYRQSLYGFNEASHLRSLRSALGMAGISQAEGFPYPLASRSAAMISGRGFRPGKRYSTGVTPFM
uniref:Uncharacterized protein n=1 Tax=Setaria digitata TaxID=48799 RepID=A0A915Q6A8_9BILA